MKKRAKGYLAWRETVRQMFWHDPIPSSDWLGLEYFAFWRGRCTGFSLLINFCCSTTRSFLPHNSQHSKSKQQGTSSIYQYSLRLLTFNQVIPPPLPFTTKTQPGFYRLLDLIAHRLFAFVPGFPVVCRLLFFEKWVFGSTLSSLSLSSSFLFLSKV